jgi:hypothetical protein
MARIVVRSSQPSTTDKTTDGAYNVTPTDSPRESRNNTLVSVRTRTSKRCSRYSYAVKICVLK